MVVGINENYKMLNHIRSRSSHICFDHDHVMLRERLTQTFKLAPTNFKKGSVN